MGRLGQSVLVAAANANRWAACAACESVRQAARVLAPLGRAAPACVSLIDHYRWLYLCDQRVFCYFIFLVHIFNRVIKNLNRSIPFTDTIHKDYAIRGDSYIYTAGVV